LAVKERMCCVCRNRKPVTDLLRVARAGEHSESRSASEDGLFFIDKKGNSNGRGCYVCPGCIDKAIKTRALNRSFKTNVGSEVYNALAETIATVYTKE